ncbi:MAG: hypothetical protein B7Y41_15610 [Hydrogenophilales bacterium 28-61-23]|nr:MAG: hypothetical protein B7Y41_15610 [Hydrogenophilales bacterium 28-61-23]
MNLKTTLESLTFALACAAFLSPPALAKEVSLNAADAVPCAKENFRGKDAKTRIRACIDELQKKKLAQEQRHREQIETWRIQLREHCAQDPRTCESRSAELDEKIRGNWRDQEGEGHAAH